LPSSDTSAANSWSKPTTTCSKSLVDIMREEEERVAARCATKTATTSTGHGNGVTATVKQPRNNADVESLTAKTAETIPTLHTSISPSCKPCLEECFSGERVDDAIKTEGGWTSVKKKTKQCSGPSTRPRDFRDIKLECVVYTCRRMFVYTVEDQKFYAGKNWLQPKTCQQCREKRRGEKCREERKDRRGAGHGYR
jgi:hypothetical protein